MLGAGLGVGGCMLSGRGRGRRRGEEWVDAVSKGGIRVVGGRWVHWWIVLGGRKRGGGGDGNGDGDGDGDGGGWEGVGRRRVERFGVGMVDWLGSLAEGVVCMWDWV
jgi:hypothetical protein